MPALLKSSWMGVFNFGKEQRPRLLLKASTGSLKTAPWVTIPPTKLHRTSNVDTISAKTRPHTICAQVTIQNWQYKQKMSDLHESNVD